MKKWLSLTLAALLFTGMVRAQSALEATLSKYKLSQLSQQSFAKEPLTADDCDVLAAYLVEQWRGEVYDRLKTEAEHMRIVRGDRVMHFAEKTCGTVPEEGHSLYISLHGGGSAPKEVNDQQWTNQFYLYQPEEGIYVAPRAPWDDWNMWFKPEMDGFLEDLIQWMVVTRDVNPNRVYLMGYSAGGDGVWRLAPRMADRWAAASMMAGHPGEAQQVNLLNLPFMIWMGAEDAAYNRNLEASKKGKVLDSLENTVPLSYIHETHIVPGKGHWMDRADTAAVAWMSNFEREPLPFHVVWQQEECVRPNLYWLEVDPAQARPGMRVEVVCEGQQVDIVRCDYDRLRIYLHDDLLNLDEKVRVVYQGRVLFDGKLHRTLATMAKTLHERGDYCWMFPAFVDIQIR